MTEQGFLDLPAAANDWHAFLQNRVHSQLGSAELLIAELTDDTTRESAQVLELWNNADIELRNADMIAGLLLEVHPDEAVRSLAEELSQRVSSAFTDRGLNHRLFDVMSAIDRAGLDADAERVVDHVLRDFRRSGIDRDDLTRERLREISERSTVVSQDFSRNIRDDVRSIRVGANSLAGLPQDFIDAHPADADGLSTITTDYPDLVPFRKFSTDADARRALTVANLNRAWPLNDDLLTELLELRAEQARLLGYASWPDFDAETKMTGSSEAIASFIERIDESSKAAAARDFEVLVERRRKDVPDADTVDSADSMYYNELLHQELFDVDSQEIRSYFDFDQVRAGLLAVTGRLFGIEYRDAIDAKPWHPDVAVYDVFSAGEPLGRIYLDLHPREGKYKHAAMFDLVSGIEGRQLPEGALVCNFPRGLMEHSDVTTIFHEFGHLVHHILGGRQRWSQFSGIATEWDFVEAPSQMLEEWAWNADILRSFALNSAGEAIPADLVKRMREADEFGTGVWARTQLYYTAISYRLHRDRPADITAAVRQLQLRYDAFAPIAGSHMAASFGHLTGYSSAYYTYLWSLVIAKDLFSAFDPNDLFAEGPAFRYRDRILARGGSADAADLVADFLGRPYSFDAFTRWLEG
jgi:thimet oligopeptidase